MNSTPAIQEAEEIVKGETKGISDILKHRTNIAAAAKELDIDIQKMSTDVIDIIESDRSTMTDWLEKYKKAVRLAKLTPKNKVKNFPFEKASNMVTPYILQAALDFNSRSTPIFIERQDICQAKIVGKEREIYFITNEDGEEEEIPKEEVEQYQKLLKDNNKAMQEQMQQAEAIAQQGGQPPEITFQPMPPLQKRTSTEKKDKADRVATAVNWDLTTGIHNWRELKDKELLMLPIVGTTFKKNHQCATENKRVSKLISPDLLICDHNKETFSDVVDKSYEYTMSRNDVVSAIETGQFTEIDLSKYPKDENEFEFYESHTWLDLDDDGFKEPYIVTIEKFNTQIVSIVPRYAVSDVSVNSKGKVVKIKAEEHFTCTTFIPDPCGGFMGMGWGILLGSMFEAINTSYNQVIDAATLANIGANSGFIRGASGNSPRAGNRQRKGEYNMKMGGFTNIETSGNNPLSHDIVNFPFQGPNPTLFSVIEHMINSVKEMTTAGNVEVQSNEAAEMYLARLRESMITTNSIRIRVAQGMTKEIDRIIDIQRDYLTQEMYESILNDEEADWTRDYDAKNFNIAFTADPSQGSDQERTAQAKVMLEESKQSGGTLSTRYAYEKFFDSIGVTDRNELDKLMPPPPEQGPDPIAEMQAQSMKMMAEAEQSKAQADIMEAEATRLTAQVKMLEAQLKAAKLQPEIENLNAETMKALSEVDKNQITAGLQKQKQINEHIIKQADVLQRGIDNARNQDRDDRREAREDSRVRSEGMV